MTPRTRPSWLIRTKLEPSDRVDGHIERPRVMHALDACLQCRLGVVHAAAGSGKTSALVQWRRVLQQRNTHVAWLSLDEDDAAPAAFVAYLVAAFEHGGSLQGAEWKALLQTPQETPPKALVAGLVNALADTDDQHVIILDDYERIENDSAHELLRFVVARMPAQCHVVVASRERPPLDLAGLKARGELARITGETLRLDHTEANQLLTGDAKRRVADADIAALIERTEGWVIALQMARVSLANSAEGTDVLRHFSGRTHEIAGYLSEQFLLGLSQDVQNFLMRTSIVERINGDLANFLCGRSDSWTLLDALADKELLTQSLDEDHRWYRYHNLFAEFLRERLYRLDPARVAVLHNNAAAWFTRNGLLSEAIRHAALGGEADEVARALEREGGWQLMLDGRLPLLRKAVEQLPSAVIERYPRLALGHVELLLKSGDIHQARRLFETLRSTSEDFRRWHGQSADAELADEATIVENWIAIYEDKPGTLADLERLQALSDRFQSSHAELAACADNILCYHCYSAGLLNEALAAGNRAIAHFRRWNYVYGETFSHLLEGKTYFAMGRQRDAETFYQLGQSMAEQHFGEESDLVAVAKVFLAEARYEANDLETARALLEHALEGIEHYEGWYDAYEAAYTTYAAIQRIENGPEAAEAVYTRAERMADRRGLPRLRLKMGMQRVHDWIIVGQGQRARTLADALGLEALFARGDQIDIRRHRIREAAGVSLARVALLETQPARAMDYLTPLVATAEKKQRHRRLAELRLLCAIAYQQMGNDECAVECLDTAVAQALFEGMKRIFIDQGQLALPALALAEQDRGRRGTNRLRDALLNEISSCIQRESHRLARQCYTLSRREVEILTELREGFSNKEIARALAVTESTVKFHLRNIFGKLGVRSRAAAARMANEQPDELGLRR